MTTGTRTTAEIVADAVQASADTETSPVQIKSPGDITFYVGEYCFEFGVSDEDATEASMILHRRHGFEVF